MTADNDLNIKPLTNLQYVVPTSQAGENQGQNKRKASDRKPKKLQEEIGEDIDESGDGTLHVIDYRA